MLVSWCCLVSFLLTFSSLHCSARYTAKDDHSNSKWSNNRPIVGIISQTLTLQMSNKFPDKSSFVAATYVKHIEAAGARVLAIKINQPEEYYKEIFESINGVLLPGGYGPQSLQYSKMARIFYNLAIDANDKGDYFPIWGTCLGIQSLSSLTSGKICVTKCNAINQVYPLIFQPSASTSRLYGNAPKEIMEILSNSSSTPNNHKMCVTPESFTAAGLDRFYDINAISKDDDGVAFVASMEAKNYPFWGIQFHPEKMIFDWKYPNIIHSAQNVAVGQYFTNFFVNQARRSRHNSCTSIEKNKYLIQNYPIAYTGKVSSYEQCYFID